MNNSEHSNHNRKDSGLVSIVVAALLMVIVALITIGFARIMQREQRQALDRQLSRQALYAAESGVNDVLRAIDNGTTGYTGDSKTDCDVSALTSIDPSDNIAYTCALFDKSPGELQFNVVKAGSKIVGLQTSSGNQFNNIHNGHFCNCIDDIFFSQSHYLSFPTL